VVDWQWLHWIQCVAAVILSGRSAVIGGVVLAQWQGGTMAVAGGRVANTHTVA
jgi:hypothetical protein